MTGSNAALQSRASSAGQPEKEKSGRDNVLLLTARPNGRPVSDPFPTRFRCHGRAAGQQTHRKKKQRLTTDRHDIEMMHRADAEFCAIKSHDSVSLRCRRLLWEAKSFQRSSTGARASDVETQSRQGKSNRFSAHRMCECF